MVLESEGVLESEELIVVWVGCLGGGGLAFALFWLVRSVLSLAAAVVLSADSYQSCFWLLCSLFFLSLVCCCFILLAVRRFLAPVPWFLQVVLPL